jgi:hypothetical protein
MQFAVLYANGGNTTGMIAMVLKGHDLNQSSNRSPILHSTPGCAGKDVAACCLLPPTGSWDVYKSIACGAPGRYRADARSGMMPNVTFKISGPDVVAKASTEYVRVDAFQFLIYE